MSNQLPEQDLSSLWQQQPVSEIDIADVTRRLKQQQRLQRWYVLSDFAGLFIGLGVLVFNWDKLPAYMSLILSGVMVSGSMFTAYLVWLRRHAVMASFEDTSHYRETLKKQYLSNQKIARVTMHSSWSSVLILLLIWGVAWLTGELTWDSFIEKGGLTTFIIICLIMLGFIVWARKREQKFKREYEQLVSQEQNSL